MWSPVGSVCVRIRESPNFDTYSLLLISADKQTGGADLPGNYHKTIIECCKCTGDDDECCSIACRYHCRVRTRFA